MESIWIKVANIPTDDARRIRAQRGQLLFDIKDSVLQNLRISNNFTVIIRFWKLKRPLTLTEKVPPHGDLSEIADSLSPGEPVDPFLLPMQQISLLAQYELIDPNGAATGRGDDDIIEHLTRDYRNLLRLGPRELSPCVRAKSNNYMDYQGKSSPLWDCRYAAETPKPTVAIAIQLYHPAFAFFSSKAFDPGFEVPPELESQTYNLLVKSAAIYRSEEERRLKIKPILGKIIGRSLLAVRNDDFTAPDGSVMGSHPGPASYILVNEGKKEIGDGGSDPSTQAAFSFLRRYQQEEAQDIAQRCCCPTFLVAQAGPWFAILGGVITSQCIVQRLTDFLWLPFHSSHDEDQCTRIARILYALRESLSQLDDWYKTIARLSPIDIGVPHPRFFPSPDHFEHDGKLVKFTYEKPFDPDPSCKTYLATANKTKVVVKFVTDYGADVHRAMEDEGFAPKLLYCGPVKVIPAMPGYGKLKMVVMDYVAGNTLADVLKSEEGCAARNSPIERLGALRNIIKSLHAKHFVYGDLRSPNIMITTEGKVQLIDFDWAGKHGEARYPLSISPCVEWPNGVSGGGYIQPEHDNAMLDLLF